MAVFRVVKTNFWTDTKTEEFTPEDRYFWLYLLTNPHTTQLGIYEISLKQMAYELGYSREAVIALLERFEERYDMIIYSRDTKEVAIKNYLKHSVIAGGAPLKELINKEIREVKNKDLVSIVFNHVKDCETLNPTIVNIISTYDSKMTGEVSPTVTGQVTPTVTGEVSPTVTGEVSPTVSPHNDNDNENENDNENDNDNDNDNENDNDNNNNNNIHSVNYLKGQGRQQGDSKQFFADRELNSAFMNFVKMRKEMKKPLTDTSVKSYIDKLVRLSTPKGQKTFDTNTAIKILDNSIRMVWADLYPLKDEQEQESRQTEQDGKKGHSNKFIVTNQQNYDFDRLENDILSN